MRGPRRTPRQQRLFSSFLGTLGLALIVSLAVGCGPKAPKPEAVLQPPPPSPVEELEAKVSELEARQTQLKQRRVELEEEFSQLKRQQEGLTGLRDEVLEAQREAAERAATMREVEAETLEPEKSPPPKVEAPTVLPPTPGGQGAKPYVVHTSSFRNPDLAFKEGKRLLGKGYQAFVSEADLGAKGQWLRVLVGRFASADEARAFAERLKGREKLSYAAPMRLPFSVSLEGYVRAPEAGEAASALERKGLHPYIVEESGSGAGKVYRLMLGAYGKRAEAEAQAKRAKEAGASSAVVTP